MKIKAIYVSYVFDQILYHIFNDCFAMECYTENNVPAEIVRKINYSKPEKEITLRDGTTMTVYKY